MPLSTEQKKEFRTTALENMDKWDAPSWFSERFPITRAGARKKLNRLKKEFPEWDSRQITKEVHEVSNGIREKLEKDIESLRRVSFGQLKDAIEKKDAKALQIWYDKATANARLRAELGRSLNVLIDARDQSTTVNVTEVREQTAAEIFAGELRCPKCGADVSGPLLAKHTGGS